MNNKTILTYTLIVCISFGLFLINGCTISKIGKEQTDYPSETEDENLEETTEATEDNEDLEYIEPEKEDDIDSREISEEEKINDDESEVQATEEIEFVELSAKHVGGNPGSITMFFDLKTGEVTGTLEMEYIETSLDGNSTVICKYLIKGDIKGTLDLKTRIIKANFSGQAISDDKGCYRGGLPFTMTGKISKDYQIARGTTSFGPEWSVFR